MDDSSRAMATWVGTLARGGVLVDSAQEAGVAVAAFVVGEDRLSDLREWMGSQPAEVVNQEQQAAIAACIWMAQADRQLDPAERELLEEIVNRSDLPYETQEALLASLDAPPSPMPATAHRATHPVLQEMLLALAWELALADGHVDPSERSFHEELAAWMGVPEARAAELRGTLSAKLGT
jgi:tellurite resistance protein